MRRRPTIAILAGAVALALALAACDGSGTTAGTGSSSATSASSSASSSSSGSSSSTGEEAGIPTYAPSEFTIGDFSVKVASASTEYDDWHEQDALVFALEVTNDGDSANDFGDTLNLSSVTQGGEELYWAYEVVDAEDSWQYAAVGSYDELEPGASAEYTYAFLLQGYDDPVVVSFDTYTEAVEGGAEVSFDVTGCESAGYQAAQQAVASRADEVANGEKSATIPGATIELGDGWYFPYVSSYSVTAENVGEDDIYISTDAQMADAAAWVADTLTAFSSHTAQDGEFNGIPVTLIEISETSWYAYLDTSEGPIEIQASGVTYDDAQAAISMTLS